MPSSCTGCGSASTSPTKFLLVCRQCARPWHHRCHRPPVSDKELIQIINLFNQARAAGGAAAKTLPWTCGACVKGKAPAMAAAGSGAVAVVAPAARAPAASGSGAARPPAPRPEQAPGPRGAPQAKAPSPIVIDDDSDDDIVVLTDPPPPRAHEPRTNTPDAPAAAPKAPTRSNAAPQAAVPLGARAPQPRLRPLHERSTPQIGTKSTPRAPASAVRPTPPTPATAQASPAYSTPGVIKPSNAARPSAPAPSRSLSAVSRALVPALDELSMQHRSPPASARPPVRTPSTVEQARRYEPRTKMHPRTSVIRSPTLTSQASESVADESDDGDEEGENSEDAEDERGESPVEELRSLSRSTPRFKHNLTRTRAHRISQSRDDDDDDDDEEEGDEEDELDELVDTPAPDTRSRATSTAIKREPVPVVIKSEYDFAPRVPPASPPLVPTWIAAQHAAPGAPPDAWARAAARAQSRLHDGNSAKRGRKAFVVVHKPRGQVAEGEGGGKGGEKAFFFSADAWMRARTAEMR